LVAVGVVLVAAVGVALVFALRPSGTPAAAGTIGAAGAVVSTTDTTDTAETSTSDTTDTSTEITDTGSSTTDSGAPVADGPQYLSDLTPVDHDPQDSGAENGQYTANAQQYLHAVDVPAQCGSGVYGTNWVDYNLGRKFTTFTATVALADTDASDSKAVFVLYADGIKIKSGPLVLGQSTPLNVPVKGVLRLRLEADNTNSGPSGCAVSDSDATADVVWGDAHIS
jgi:hypothetical protein